MHTHLLILFLNVILDQGVLGILLFFLYLVFLLYIIQSNKTCKFVITDLSCIYSKLVDFWIWFKDLDYIGWL